MSKSKRSKRHTASLKEAVLGAIEAHLRTGCEDTPRAHCAVMIWLDIEDRLALPTQSITEPEDDPRKFGEGWA